jgi:nifR3 family TIM-barrel protein
MVQISNIELGEYPLILAPMEDISDPPFRQICEEYGADLVYSEFISSEGLIRNAGQSVSKLDILPGEKRVAIQIYGHNPESMKQAANMVAGFGPDMIDLNFGCPVKKVVNKGAGAALLKNIPALVNIAAEVVKSSKIPITVKTRLGWDENSIVIVELAEMLQDVGVQALAIHTRTAKQFYRGEANWEWLNRVKENQRLSIPVFGNGDINHPVKAKEYRDKYNTDGMMIGRATVGNPWIFREIKHYFEHGTLLPPPTIAERVDVCRRHLITSVAWKKERVAINEMRKHYRSYFNSIPDFKPYRIRLVEEKTFQGLLNVLEEISHLTE